MEPIYSMWGRFGPVQYAPTTARTLTDASTLALLPFVRTPHTTKYDLRDTMQRNLWTVYESLWRMWTPRHHATTDLRPATIGGIRQGVSAWTIEDLLAGVDALPDYWVRNRERLFESTATQWDRVARIRTAYHAPLVLRFRPDAVFNPTLYPVYDALWHALDFASGAAIRERGHYWVLNTSNLGGTTLREKAQSWLALDATFRERTALFNDDIDAAQHVALCTKFNIRAVLDVARAHVDGKRVVQAHPTFGALRRTWRIESHATRYHPGFVVFVREPRTASAAAVDRYVQHFARHDPTCRWTAPCVVLAPTLF